MKTPSAFWFDDHLNQGSVVRPGKNIIPLTANLSEKPINSHHSFSEHKAGAELIALLILVKPHYQNHGGISWFLVVCCLSAEIWPHCKQLMFGIGSVLYLFCLSICIYCWWPAMKDTERWHNLNCSLKTLLSNALIGFALTLEENDWS